MKAYMELVNNMLLTAEVQTCTHQHAKPFKVQGRYNLVLKSFILTSAAFSWLKYCKRVIL